MITNEITLDNSAFSLLYCERRFELAVKKGLVAGGANYFADFGNALHKALEYLSNKVEVESVFAKIFTEYPSIDTVKLVRAVSAFLQLGELPPVIELNGKKAIELKFRYFHSEHFPVNARNYSVYLAGTVDRIELDGDTLVIRDYKTAGDFTTGKAKEKLELYRSSFQLPFYIYALRNSGILPAEHTARLSDRKYRTEYSVIFYNLDPIRIETIRHGPYPSDFLDTEVPNIVERLIDRATNIYESDVRAPMTGLTTYNGCKYCSFRRACLVAGTQAELEFLEGLESRDYDPMKFR
jgi:hypothetical protein